MAPPYKYEDPDPAQKSVGIAPQLDYGGDEVLSIPRRAHELKARHGHHAAPPGVAARGSDLTNDNYPKPSDEPLQHTREPELNIHKTLKFSSPAAHELASEASRHVKPVKLSPSSRAKQEEDDIVLRWSRIDEQIPSDPRNHAKLTGSQEQILARLAAYFTGRLRTPVEHANSVETKEITDEIKVMLSHCWPGKNPRYSTDAEDNKKQAVVGRLVFIDSIEPLGNTKLGLGNDNVIPSPRGLGIAKSWPGVVTQLLPKSNGFLRQRVSSKDGKGLTGAHENDYYAQYNIRILPVDDSNDPNDYPDDKWKPLQVHDEEQPDRWRDKVLTSTTEFVSFNQPSSWQNAHIDPEGFSRMSQMKVDASFDYAWALARANEQSFSNVCPKIKFDGRMKRSVDNGVGYTEETARKARCVENADVSANGNAPMPDIKPSARTKAANELGKLKMGSDTAVGDGIPRNLQEGQDQEMREERDNPPPLAKSTYPLSRPNNGTANLGTSMLDNTANERVSSARDAQRNGSLEERRAAPEQRAPRERDSLDYPGTRYSRESQSNLFGSGQGSRGSSSAREYGHGRDEPRGDSQHGRGYGWSDQYGYSEPRRSAAGYQNGGRNGGNGPRSSQSGKGRLRKFWDGLDPRRRNGR